MKYTHLYIFCLLLCGFCNAATNLQASHTTEIIAFHSADEAISCLYPENDIEREVISSEEWLAGARWGEPRNGHPEGAIIYHIHEVLDNVEKYYGDSSMREKLRIITIIHDTFKNKFDNSLPKGGENQHGMIARRFAEKYIADQGILEIIQRHDDAFFAWKFGAIQGDWDKAYQNASKLIDILGDDLELFIAFFECDNRTGDKTPESVDWFKQYAETYR